MGGLARDEVESALSRKGFSEDDSKGADHRWFRPYVGGKKTAIATKTSRGTKYKHLGEPLVKHMAVQIRLTKQEFEQLVECSIDGAKYIELLRERGVTP